mgnify:FL=1
MPGDPSSAAFLVAAALLAGTSSEGVTLRDVGVNPTRTGFLEVLAAMGARVELANRRDAAGEPIGDLVVGVGQASLRGVTIGGELVVRAIDEIPILAAVAARAEGTTVVRDAAELRVKESDRVRSTVAMLRAFGVEAEEREDGLVVVGSAVLRGSVYVDAAGDHRIAMAAAALATAGANETRVVGVDNVATSFPTFATLLGQLGGDVRVA